MKWLAIISVVLSTTGWGYAMQMVSETKDPWWVLIAVGLGFAAVAGITVLVD